MHLCFALLAPLTIATIYGPCVEATMKYLDDLDQVIKYSGAWNFRTETNALNGAYSLSKDPNAAASVVYSFRSVDFWSPLWPAPIQLVISVGSRATVVDLQDHDAPAVPLPTDVPPRSTKPSRIVWSYRGLVQQEYTIDVRASGANSPAYVVVDTFGFDLEDPQPTSTAPTVALPPNPTTPLPPTSRATPSSNPTTPSSSPNSSASTSSSISSTTTSSTASNSTSSDANIATMPRSSSLPRPLLPTIQPTIIQGNSGSSSNSGNSRLETKPGLIAGLSVAGCILLAVLVGLVWFTRRKKRAPNLGGDGDLRRRASLDFAGGSEAPRPYSLAEKATSSGENGGGRGGVVGLGGVFTRVTGKRNMAMDASPIASSTDTQRPGPRITTTNEKHRHDTNYDSTPTSGAALPRPSPSQAVSFHESEQSPQSRSSIHSENNQAPQASASIPRSSLLIARHHPPSMIDSPPTYTAADPTSALWVQGIRLAAAIPALEQNRSAVPHIPSNGESFSRIQMDPELD